MTLPGYDDWKLATPYDDEPTCGMDEGETCGRYTEPDDDAPRGYKPCNGEMIEDGGAIICDTCEELAA